MHYEKTLALIICFAIFLPFCVRLIPLAQANPDTLLISQYEYIGSSPYTSSYVSSGCSIGTNSAFSASQLEWTSGKYQTCALASGTKRAYHYYNVPNGYTSLYASGLFYFADGLDTLTDSEDRIGVISFQDNADWGVGAVRIRYSSTSGDLKFEVYSRDGASGTKLVRSTLTATNAVSYLIELYVKLGDSGLNTLWVNGNMIANMTCDNNAQGNNLYRVHIGLPYAINNNGATDLRVDGICLTDYQIGTNLLMGVGVGTDAYNYYLHCWFAGWNEGSWFIWEDSVDSIVLATTQYNTWSMDEYCDDMPMGTIASHTYGMLAVRLTGWDNPYDEYSDSDYFTPSDLVSESAEAKLNGTSGSIQYLQGNAGNSYKQTIISKYEGIHTGAFSMSLESYPDDYFWIEGYLYYGRYI
jgi:hypothetical protein